MHDHAKELMEKLQRAIDGISEATEMLRPYLGDSKSDEHLGEMTDVTSKPVQFKWNKEKTEVSYTEEVIVRDEKDGKRYPLVEEETIAILEIMCRGKGINILSSLLRDYPKGRPSADWIKPKGCGWVNFPDGEEQLKLHWFEHPKVGAVMIKIKREGYMLEWKNQSGATIPCNGVLTDDGIMLESGNTLTTGKVVDFAREASRLWHSKDYTGYLTLINERAADEFDDEEWRLLRNTIINKRGDTVGWALVDISDQLGEPGDLLNTAVNAQTGIEILGTI